MYSSPDALGHRPPKWLKPAGVIGLGLAAAVAAGGVAVRTLHGRHLQQQTTAEAVPTVDLVSPSSAQHSGALVLPGDVEAYYNAVIHARVSGYLKSWSQDIGARVKAGQVLAEIDTPELDQQLEQAKADMATAVANENLARTTAERWTSLLARDAVSKQETDEKTGDYAAKAALTQAAKANVDRLNAFEAFKHIVAPFDGVVTARNTDIGALIAAGNPADPGLFTVSDVHRLRIYVRVPQNYSAQIKPGDEVDLTAPEYPNRTFQAKLITTSGAIAAQSGSVLVELQMDNADNSLKPGEYVQARFNLPAMGGVTTLPATALLFRQTGMNVGVVDADGRVRLRPVKVQRDQGAVVEVTGVDPSDKVINNPSDSLANGQQVRPSQAPAAAADPKG